MTTDPIAYACGLCGPVNPGGTGGWGFSIRSAGEVLVENRGRVAAGPDVTNNVMEYVAVGKAIQAYRDLGLDRPLRVYSSSQLVVCQMRGEFRARKGAYMVVLETVRSLVSTCDFEVRWQWMPLSKNLWAMELAKAALLEAGATPFSPEHQTADESV